MKINKSILSHFDFIQPFLILPIIVISHILIAEISEPLAFKQYLYFTAGFITFVIFFIFPLRKFFWIVPMFYWINVILLFSVDVFGVSKLGAKRWLEIPFINLTIQPSEFMKPALILMLAYLIRKNPPDQNGYNLKNFIKLAFYILLPFVLIIEEPDLGTALILLLTGFGILFIIGVEKKIWITLIASIAIASPILYASLHDYQKKRIADFIGEESSYQVKQSIIAIGNGGLFGKDKENATQSHFKFLPIATSDFILAYNVERFGFFGATGLILLYFLLIIHILSLNYKDKDDWALRVIASGVGILIFIYAGVNISMVIGFAPVVGVPLPFFSYGGSSFITFMAFFGILQNLLTFKFYKNYNAIQIRSV